MPLKVFNRFQMFLALKVTVATRGFYVKIVNCYMTGFLWYNPLMLNIQFALGLKSYHTCHFGMSFRGVIPHLYCTKMKPAKFVEANETFKRKSLHCKNCEHFWNVFSHIWNTLNIFGTLFNILGTHDFALEHS